MNEISRGVRNFERSGVVEKTRREVISAGRRDFKEVRYYDEIGFLANSSPTT